MSVKSFNSPCLSYDTYMCTTDFLVVYSDIQNGKKKERNLEKKPQKNMTLSFAIKYSRGERSEERRVGKEC